MSCRTLLLILPLLFLLPSCDPNRVHDDNTDIPDFIWNAHFKPSFTVEIPDTQHLYNIYANIRHTTFYQFSNMWIMIYTTFPDGTTLKKRVELELANKEGKWYGDCLGDICDLQLPIQQKAYFNAAGEYTFEFEQIMRMESLPFVMSVGLRIEKAGERSLADG